MRALAPAALLILGGCCLLRASAPVGWNIEPPPAACVVVLSRDGEPEGELRFDREGRLLYRWEGDTTEQLRWSAGRLEAIERFIEMPPAPNVELVSIRGGRGDGDRVTEQIVLRYDGARVTGWTKRTDSETEHIQLRYEGERLVEITGRAQPLHLEYQRGLLARVVVGDDQPEEAEVETDGLHVTKISWPHHRVRYRYDDAGCIIREEQLSDGGGDNIAEWSWNAAGRIEETRMSWPSAEQPSIFRSSRYEYNAQSKLIRRLDREDAFADRDRRVAPVDYRWSGACEKADASPPPPDVRTRLGACFDAAHCFGAISSP